MPWSYPNNVPKVAKNWSASEQRKCVRAANAVLKRGGSDQDAIFACIRAAGRSKKQEDSMTQEEFDALSDKAKLQLYYHYFDEALEKGEQIWEEVEEAKWTRAFINTLPDISFAVIEPAYKSGKEKNKNARHLPHHGQISKHTLTNVDKGHLRNALARMNQIQPITDSISTEELRSRAKSHLIPHAKKVLPNSQWAKGEDAQEAQGAKPKRALLTETVFTALELREAEDGYHHATLLLTHGDKINKNNRVYPMSIWKREIPKAKEKVVEGRFLGLADHPGPFQGPSILDTVIKFTDLWIEGKDVFGDVIIIPTTKGQDVVELAKAGVKIGVSSRGYGTVRKGEWTDPDTGTVYKEANIVNDDYELIGFDLVLQPSVEDAGIVRFEQVGQMGMTVEKLEACWPELVSAVREAAIKETLSEVGFETIEALKDQLERLDGEVESLTEAKGELSELVEAILGVFGLTAEDTDDPAGAVATLYEQMLAEKQALTEKLEARDHLIEKVQGEKAAWLILLKLWEAETPAEVDEKYDDVKSQAEAMLGQRPPVSGKGMVFVEGDDDTPTEEIRKQQLRILRAAGLAP